MHACYAAVVDTTVDTVPITCAFPNMPFNTKRMLSACNCSQMSVDGIIVCQRTPRLLSFDMCVVAADFALSLSDIDFS